MSHPREKGRVFRLLWVIGLVSNHSKCFVTLAFQHTNSKYVLVDTIPPELLSYCTVGAYYSEGRRWNIRKPDGTSLPFTINSDENNCIIPTADAFSDKEYDLSLKGKLPDFSNAFKNQQCFVQQLNDFKVVIPCFVLVSTYYFKSTSLREAVLSRKMESLFQECSLDHESKHAEIYLKPAGNIGDAKNIVRFVHDDFARSKINLCKDYLYAYRESSHRPIKADFPVKQKIDIKARGLLTTGNDGGKTFIVFQFEKENSAYPFDTIEIKHDMPENEEPTDEPRQGDYPKSSRKPGNRLNTKHASDNIVRQLLESSDHIENENAKAIKETNTVIKIPLEDDKKPWYEHSDEVPELSTQPGSTKDTNTAGASIREKDEQEREHLVSTLDNFKIFADSLRDFTFTIKSGEAEVSGKIVGYNYVEKIVWKRDYVKRLSKKESYDNSQSNRRKCAYVTFSCHGKNVCLVEIDQAGMTGSGLSTVVLISDAEIRLKAAESVVKGFVLHITLEKRSEELKSQNIHLKTKKHPSTYDEAAQISWRAKLIGKILSDKREKTPNLPATA
jgi:hypothetical protein